MGSSGHQTPTADTRQAVGASSRRSSLIVIGLCALALAPTLTYRMGTDQGNMAYMGAAILDGRLPYLRTWENNLPGLMFLQAFEILLLGKSIAMFRLFDLAFQLGNAYLIFRITTKIAGDRAAAGLAAIIYCLIYQGYGPWNTAQREAFGLLFVLIGFWLYLTAERRSAWWTAAGIGLGLGLAVIIKPTFFALVALYLPLALHLTSRRAWGLAIVAAAGIVLPVTGVVLGCWALGALPQFYDSCIAYQAIYTVRLRGSEPLSVYWMQKLEHMGRNALVLPLVCAPFLLTGTMRRERSMLLLGYLGSAYAVFVQGTFAGYHYLPGLGLGAILIGDVFSRVTRWVLGRREFLWRNRQIPVQLLLVIVIVAAAAPQYLRWRAFERLLALRFLEPPAPREFRNGTVFDFTEDFDVAAYLRSHTQPQEPIQVWGNESLVYYLAGRNAASRFHFTHPLVMRPPGGALSPLQLRWRGEFLNEVEQGPPSYVAVVRQDNWWWAPDEKTSEELLDDFPAWKQVIAQKYRLEQTIGRFLIYRRR